MVNYKVPALENFEWQKPVADKDLSAPPTGPAKGVRYIIASGASGAWAGHADHIALYTGSVWEFVVATAGMQVWVTDENVPYLFKTSWIPIFGDGKSSPYNNVVNGSFEKVSAGATIDSKTTLLLHMDGANDSETITDSSPRANAVTNVGNAKIKTAVKKFGTGSLLLNGTTQYATVPSDQKLTNGSFETWTGLTDVLVDGAMEAWTNPTTLTNWTKSIATLDREASVVKAGTYSAKLSGSAGMIYQDLASPATYRNKTLVFGCWVYASASSGGYLHISSYGGEYGNSIPHSGVAGWEYLTCTIPVSGTETLIRIECCNANGQTAYFDKAICYEQLSPTGWTLVGSGATVAREEGTIKVGTYSAKLTRNGTNCYILQDIQNAGGHNLAYWKGRTITFGCWVYATVASRVNLQILDNATSTNSSSHTGVAGWEHLTVTHTVSSSATAVNICMYINTGDTTAYFDGAFVTDDSAANFNFGSGDFTIDTWAYFTDVTTATLRVLCGSWRGTTADPSRGFILYWQQSTGTLQFLYTVDGTTQIIKSVSWTPTINTQYHIEVDRSGNNLYIFVNGVQVGTTGDMTGITIANSSEVFSIGANINTSGSWANFFIGYLDEFRVSKGIARHTANFTVKTLAYGYSPSNWTLSGAGATVDIEESTVKVGAYSAKLTRNGTDCSIYQQLETYSGFPVSYWKGRTVTFGAWVWCATPNVAVMTVTYDDSNLVFSNYHTGSSTWEYLTVTATFTNSITLTRVSGRVRTGDATAYFDGATVNEGYAPHAFREPPMIPDASGNVPLAGHLIGGDGTTSPFNNISNGSFEAWTGLTDLLLDGAMEVWTSPTELTKWTLGGGTLAQETTTIKAGTYSAKLTASGADAFMSQNLASPATYRSKVLMYSCWVYGGANAQVSLQDTDGVNYQINTASHSAVVGWEFLTATLTIQSDATAITMYCKTLDASVSYYDKAILYEQLAPTGWALAVAGETVAREEGTIKVGTYSLKLTRNGSDSFINQDCWATLGGGTIPRGKTVTYGCWVYAPSVGVGRITVYDGTTPVRSSNTLVNTWEYLTVTLTIGSSATYLQTSCDILTSNCSVYFDGAMINEGFMPYAFSEPKPDYEEGTWTPIATSAAGAITSYTSEGFYAKVGKLVYCTGRVSITNVGTGSGAMNLAGFPFTAIALRQVGACFESGATGKMGSVYVIESTKTGVINDYAAGTAVAASYTWFFTITYRSV